MIAVAVGTSLLTLLTRIAVAVEALRPAPDERIAAVRTYVIALPDALSIVRRDLLALTEAPQ